MGEVVEVSVHVAARPETVFRIVAEPEGFPRWMGEGAELEPTVGGRVRVPYPGGTVALGEVLELTPPRRIAWTWGFEGGDHGMEPGSTRVVIELQADGDGTRVTLRHSGLPEAIAEGTASGWRHYASVLAAQAAEAELGDRLEPLVTTFAEALNETDAERRMDLLAECFEEGGTFRDPAGITAGLDELSAFIGGTHGVRPGIRFELDDEIDQSHDWIRFGWRWTDGDGNVLISGLSVAQVSMEGRITQVVGFHEEP